MSAAFPIPMLFVLLWSSAYIAIDYCSAHIEPATFVVVRALITAILLLSISFIVKVGWPGRWQEFFSISVVGILIHGIYGGGVFASINYGIDVGLCALILSLQPILTVLLSSIFLDEKITRRKAFGILLGFAGVSVVILDANSDSTLLLMQNGRIADAGNGLFAISLCVVALLGISSATIVQKRYCGETRPIPATCIQYIAAAVFMLPIAMTFESMQINFNLNFILGLSWLVVFVSIGAMCLLMTLIKHGDAGSVASLLYLVTPLVALEAWILFGDQVTLTSVFGMLLCMTGVIAVNYVSTTHSESTVTRPRQKLIFGFVFRNIRVRVDHVL